MPFRSSIRCSRSSLNSVLAKVSSLITISPGPAADDRRAAVFGTSPRTVMSVAASSDPTEPINEIPLWIPMPSGIHGPSVESWPVLLSSSLAASMALA